jgi:hypothetical protein
MSNNPNCEYCDKRGVPILPLRYAIAFSNTGAPQVTNKPSIEITAAAGQYTLRTMRSGYLNVFDEARKRWDEYFVTPDGYFFKIHKTKGQPLVLPKKPFNCPDEGHRAVASCITIPDAKNATKVWLAFSDVQWTEAVRKKHDSVDYRKQHMRCVDVKAYTASADAEHCLPIKDVGSKVAEYVFDKAVAHKSLGFSPFSPVVRKGQSQRLIEECERLAPSKGFAVVLADAAGIAAELDSLMTMHASNFANHDSRKRPLMVSSAVLQIKEAIHSQAIQAEEQAAEELAREYITQPDILSLISSDARQRREKQYEALRTVTHAEAEKAANRVWKEKYSTKFNEQAMNAWRAQFEKESKAFDEKIITPLAKALIEWLDSNAMKKAFECQYDEQNLDSGEVYTRVAHMVIRGAQDKKICREFMIKKLSGEFTPDNFLLNATVFNQKDFKDQVKKAVTVNLDPRSFPIDAAIGFQTEWAKKLTEGCASTLSPYLLSVNAPLISMFNTMMDGVARPLWTALAMHSGKTFVSIEVTGSVKKFRARLIAELLRQSGQVLNPAEMKRAVKAQLRRLEVAGIKLDGTEKKRFVLLIDPANIKRMPQDLKPSAQAAWLANAIRTPEQLEAIQFGEWKNSLAKPSAIAKGSIPFVGGTLAAIWQYHAMNKLGEDNDKAMSHEAKEASWRLQAGTMAFWGTVGDVAGQGLEKATPYIPRFGRGFASFIASSAQWLGKRAGFVGAWIMAGWDVTKAWESGVKGQYGMAALYLSSSFLGAYIGYLALAGMIPFAGWIAILALIGITLLIEFFKDNKIQEWLENGYWGKKQYKTADDELKQLEMAVR